MRVVLLANNRLGARVAHWLAEQGTPPVALVLHPDERARHADDIRAAAPGVPVFDGARLNEPDVREALAAVRPDLGVSVLFGYLLRPELLDVFAAGCVNLHPGLLPYNRGAFPNVWAIVDRTPAGVTLHHVDEGIDSGDVIAQREVAVEPVDTGESLYGRLEDAAFALFCETWPRLLDGSAPRSPQVGAGTFHRVADAATLDEIDPEATVRAGELIDLLRARTFTGHAGAYVVRDGRRVEVRVALRYLDE